MGKSKSESYTGGISSRRECAENVSLRGLTRNRYETRRAMYRAFRACRNASRNVAGIISRRIRVPST